VPLFLLYIDPRRAAAGLAAVSALGIVVTTLS
jgi:hypothetical protein